MEKTDDFRELAFLYFDGKISRADEARLYIFIHGDDANMALFRRWEQEWLTERQDDSVVAQGWKDLQARMADKPGMTVRQDRRKPAHARFWYLAAAVALVCVAVFSFRLVMDAFRNDTEKYFVFEAPKGEKSKLTLADGTVVWLNSGSVLRCPADFDKDDRRVQMTGEAYFEVTRQGGSEFTVNTGVCDIVVKGTKFDVTAYADDDFVQATLLEGKIEFRHAGGTVEMNPGEQVHMLKASGRLTKTRVDASQSSAWTEGRIEYDRITLGELLPRLARHYDVDFHLQSDSLASKSLRISVRNGETVDDVMAALARILQVDVRVDGRDIYIR